ncbi:MAG: ABC transporter substrate-binding protein [Candidatus Eremiobacteraeota bacterium]|nr:ABC transporter substrate-binding protein [Candidatus Eremiobacteraeota bacterium]
MRIILVCLALLVGCKTNPGQGGSKVPPVPADNVLVVAKPDDPVGLDPANVTDAESSQVCRSLYDTLVQYARDSMEIEPALAESWETSEDGLVWTFKLRQGVKFHDGTPFDAEAVKLNFERQFKPDHPLRFAGNKFLYWTDIWGSPSKLDQVEVVDEHTVKLHLTQPVAPFLQNLAMPFFAIVSPTALKEHKEDFFKHPVGTGAYKFVEWKEREKIVLEANPDYWGGKPKLDQVIFKPVKDSTSRQLQLEKGAVGLITGLLLENVKRLQDNPAVTVETQPGMNIGFLAINNQQKPFDDPRVRQALYHAIDRKTIVDELYQGLAEVADSPLPPAVWGRAKLEDYDYDPEKAKKLLAEAGYPDGFKTELWYMSAPRPYFPEPKVTAEVLGSMLKNVGIEAELSAVDWSVYLEEIGKGHHQLALGGWIGDHGDPDNYLYILFDSDNVDTERGGTNVCLYSNPQVHEELTRAQKELNRTEREKLYLKAQQQIHDDCPWVPLVYASQTAAHHPRLKGFSLHPTGTLLLDKVYWER